MAFVAFMAFLVLLFLFVVEFIKGSPLPVFQTFSSYVDAIVYYLGQGMAIVELFVPLKVAVFFMRMVLAAVVLKYVYKFAIWVLRKIPFAHIS